MSDSSTTNNITSTALTYVKATKPETKRAIAVLAAMELIKSDVTTSTSSSRLESHISNLSEYADLIEAAFNKK